MDGATIPCEQCGQQVARGSCTYSTAGQLVCPSCAAKGVLADNDARADASRRSVRIVGFVSAALLIGVPSIMIAAGLAQYVATGLIIVGVLFIVGGRQALRMGDKNVARLAIFVMLAGVGAAVLGGVLFNALGHH